MLYIYINTICIKECKLLLYCRKMFNQKCALCKKSFHWLKCEIKKKPIKLITMNTCITTCRAFGRLHIPRRNVTRWKRKWCKRNPSPCGYIKVRFVLQPPAGYAPPAAAANKSKGNCKRQVNLAWSITGSHFMTQWTSGGASPPGADHVKMHHLHRPPHIKQDNLFCTFGWNCCKLN